MEIICYALSAAVLVLTGAVISGGVTLPKGVPRENTAETAADKATTEQTNALRKTHLRASEGVLALKRGCCGTEWGTGRFSSGRP